jgi:hypothetical protein
MTPWGPRLERLDGELKLEPHGGERTWPASPGSNGYGPQRPRTNRTCLTVCCTVHRLTPRQGGFVGHRLTNDSGRRQGGE